LCPWPSPWPQCQPLAIHRASPLARELALWPKSLPFGQTHSSTIGQVTSWLWPGVEIGAWQGVPGTEIDTWSGAQQGTWSGAYLGPSDVFYLIHNRPSWSSHRLDTLGGRCAEASTHPVRAATWTALHRSFTAKVQSTDQTQGSTLLPRQASALGALFLHQL
jgi:hypothetical protein